MATGGANQSAGRPGVDPRSDVVLAPGAGRWNRGAARAGSAGGAVAQEGSGKGGAQPVDVPGAQAAEAKAARPSWADQSENAGADDDDDIDCDDDWDSDVGDMDQMDGDADECADEPSPAELRQLWQQEEKAVRALERQGLPSDSRVLAAARRARDEAKREWDMAKDPHPLYKRMQWAQGRLEKAQASLAKSCQALDDFLEQAQRKEDELRAKVDEAEERVHRRQCEMDALHEEAGAQTGAERRAESAGTAEKVRADIDSSVAPELAALAEKFAEGSDERQRANLLMAKLATIQHQLASVQAKAPQGRYGNYDLEQQDERTDDGMLDDQGPRDRDGDHGVWEGGERDDDGWQTARRGRARRSTAAPSRPEVRTGPRTADGAARATPPVQSEAAASARRTGGDDNGKQKGNTIAEQSTQAKKARLAAEEAVAQAAAATAAAAEASRRADAEALELTRRRAMDKIRAVVQAEKERQAMARQQEAGIQTLGHAQNWTEEQLRENARQLELQNKEVEDEAEKRFAQMSEEERSALLDVDPCL